MDSGDGWLEVWQGFPSARDARGVDYVGSVGDVAWCFFATKNTKRHEKLFDRMTRLTRYLIFSVSEKKDFLACLASLA